MSRHRVPEATRDAVYARSHMRCERCGDAFGPFAVHHRKLLSQGGTDDIWNLVLLCDVGGCHDKQVHGEVKRANAEGWIVPSHADPAVVPVLMDGLAWLLTAEGDYALSDGAA